MAEERGKGVSEGLRDVTPRIWVRKYTTRSDIFFFSLFILSGVSLEFCGEYC